MRHVGVNTTGLKKSSQDQQIDFRTDSFRVGLRSVRMKRMDSRDFSVTLDSREDATLEELSGEHGESREIVVAGENVIPGTDGEEEQEEQAQAVKRRLCWLL